MKAKLINLTLVCGLGAMLGVSAFAQQSTTAFTSAQLAERTIQRRAVETVIWGIPIRAGETALRQNMGVAGYRVGEVTYWKQENQIRK
jgi:hypothetical protein